MLPISIEKIKEARARIAQHINQTPLMRLDPLLPQSSSKILVKAETFQKTGAFKIRGATNYLLKHLEEAKKKGVVTASAGNHGQALAAAGNKFGVPATIVMPMHTPAVKTENARRLGARIELVGTTLEESFAFARKLEKDQGTLFVHPFADEDVIAGQGTVALEMLEKERFEDAEAVVCPIGGGGLISGITTVFRALRPNLKIYGVAAKNVPTSWEQFHGKSRSPYDIKHTLAEGVAVKRPNNEIMDFLKENIDDFFVIGEESIAHAIALLAEHGKIVTEGAGALPLAAIVEGKIREKKVALILSGGNIDLPTLSRVLQRGLVEQGRLTRLLITGIDRPGLLHSITEVLSELHGNIIQVSHTRGTLDIGVGDAEIEVDIETRAAAHTSEIIRKLKDNHLRVERVF